MTNLANESVVGARDMCLLNAHARGFNAHARGFNPPPLGGAFRLPSGDT